MKEQFKIELLFYRGWRLIDAYEKLFSKKMTSKVWKEIVMKGEVKKVVRKHLRELTALNTALNDPKFDDDLKCVKESFSHFIYESKQLRKPIGKFSLAMLHYEDIDESLTLK